MGIGTTLCDIYILPYLNIIPGRGWNKERQREEERNEIKEKEFTIYD
jgi:hypothetical protein